MEILGLVLLLIGAVVIRSVQQPTHKLDSRKSARVSSEERHSSSPFDGDHVVSEIGDTAWHLNEMDQLGRK